MSVHGPLLTIQDVARILNVSVPTIRRLVWAKEISYIDVNKGGKQIIARFTEEHIQEFLRRKEVKAG